MSNFKEVLLLWGPADGKHTVLRKDHVGDTVTITSPIDSGFSGKRPRQAIYKADCPPTFTDDGRQIMRFRGYARD